MLRLAKLEGDAAFAYVIAEAIEGSTLPRRRSRARTSRSGAGCATSPRPRSASATLACGSRTSTSRCVVHHGPGRSPAGRRARGAARVRRDPRPPPAQERRRRGDRDPGLCAVHGRLHQRRWASTIPARQGFVEHRDEPPTSRARSRRGCGTSTPPGRRSRHRTPVLIEGKTMEQAYAFEYTTRAAASSTWEYITSPAPAAAVERATRVVEAVAHGAPRRRARSTTASTASDAIVEEILDYRPYRLLDHPRAGAGARRCPRSTLQPGPRRRCPDGGTTRRVPTARSPGRATGRRFGQMLPDARGHDRRTASPRSRQLLEAEARRASRGRRSRRCRESRGRFASEPVTA